jgi:hypothetical protein
MNKKQIILLSSVIAIAIGGFITYEVIKKRRNDGKGNNGTKKVKGEGGNVKVSSQTANLIGKKVSISDLGYTNVRSTASIDDGYIGSWFGLRVGGNVIGEVSTNPVGTILDTKSGDDGFIWYKIKLNKSIDGISDGWVREDAVNLK